MSQLGREHTLPNPERASQDNPGTPAQPPPQPDAAPDPHLDPAPHLPRCTVSPQNLIDGFAGKGAWRDGTVSGSFACQDLKSLRSHFSPLLPSCPHHSCFTAASCLQGGRPTAPNRTPHSGRGVSPLQIWHGAATFHKSSWMPPQSRGGHECLNLGSTTRQSPVLKQQGCPQPAQHSP